LGRPENDWQRFVNRLLSEELEIFPVIHVSFPNAPIGNPATLDQCPSGSRLRGNDECAADPAAVLRKITDASFSQ